MSTKTIAVESSVYEKLARQKRPSESFTKTIDRLVDAANDGTCAAAVKVAASIWQSVGNDGDSDRMERYVAESRQNAGWDVERPE